MSTELPTIRIHETDFFVELRGMQFVQVDQPDNCILFDHVQDDITSCVILYDTVTKNVFQGTWEIFQQSSTVVEVRLPALAELDKETLSRLMLESVNTDHDLIRSARSVGQQHKAWRIQNKIQKER